MKLQNFFIVSVFLVFILAASGALFGQRVIDLGKVWGDMRVLGVYNEDRSGRAVASGDINGDGFMDIIIGADSADIGEPPYIYYNVGAVYVIFGSGSPPSTLDLSTESADITVWGAAPDDHIGTAVASGDINNDGYDDIIIGAPYADPGTPSREGAGATYVIFGKIFSSPTNIYLLHQPADITIYGAYSDDFCGNALDCADVNGDGIDDLIIGANGADPGSPPRASAGEIYVIFGSSSPPSTLDLSTESADITIGGDVAEEGFGSVISSGDVNGDAYDDLIIGASKADPGTPARLDAGETYVIFGSSFPHPPYTIDLSTDQPDITVCGDDVEDYSGYAVASGDVNNDGYDDIIIGAGNGDPGIVPRTDAGEAYVIFGFSPSSSVTIDLSTESADITICGDDADEHCGRNVASGDVNGNGCDDLIIVAPQAIPGYNRGSAGETYIIFGSSFPSPPYLIDLYTQSADITVCGDDAQDQAGSAIASGDVNGDGYDDLIIGASLADPGDPPRDRAGETYVVFGGGPLVVAHGLGGKSWIKEFDIFGNSIRSFKAFGAVNSQGEVHLAISDIDKDGHDEIAAGQGEGGKSWVKFFEVDGSPISAFKAFGAGNTNGELHLVMGNFDAVITSDNEIAIAQGEGGQSWVKVFETDGTYITSFKAFGAANAQGEVHLAAGDLENADRIDEIVAGMGEGGSSWVKIFSNDGTVIRSFRVFNAVDNPGGEVRLAVGNFDADADLEIAAATGYNGGNKVRLFDKDGTLIKQFLAFGFGGNTNGDVQIAAADIDNDGVDEIICGHGEGGSSMVKVFKADGTFIRSFKAFGAVNAQGEVHLGKSNF